MEAVLKSEEAEEVISNPANSGLILVHLDFHDGSKCKIWLQPDIVKRLQNGDDALMEELRLQHLSTTAALQQPEQPQQSQQMKRKLITATSATGDSIPIKTEDGGDGVMEVLVDDLEVKRIRADDGIQTIAVEVDESNLASELVEVNLEAAGVYLEQLSEGAENYIELPTREYQGFRLQQGLILESMEQNSSGTEKLKPAYPPRRRKKTALRRYMKYTIEDRDEAVRMVKAGLLSQQEASRKYNIPQGTLSDHVRTAGSTNWKCSVCGKVFTTEVALETHNLTHYEPRQYLCDFCGFNTKDRTVLLKHRLMKHIEAATDDYEEEPVVMQNPYEKPKVTAWTAGATKMFLQEYENILDLYDDPNMKRKHLWHTLADRMVAKGHIVNARQCCIKWKTMYSSLKSFKDHGEERRAFSYFDDLEEFLERNKDKRLDFVHTGQALSEKERTPWSDEAIRLLIMQYGLRRQQFESTEFKRKALWKDIYKVFADKGYTFTEAQVQNKWKVLYRTFKNYQSMNLSPEELVQVQNRMFPWYEDMSNVLPGATQIVAKEETVTDDNIAEEALPTASEQNTVVVEKEVSEDMEIKAGEQSGDFAVYEIQSDGTYLQVNSAVVENSSIEEIENLTSEANIQIIDESQKTGDISEVIEEEETTTKTTTTLDDIHVQVRKDVDIKIENSNQFQIENVISTTAPAQSLTVLELNDSKSFSKRVEWSDEAVQILLTEYTNMLDKFRNIFVKKKLLWQKMAERFIEKGYNMTAAQLENKWRVLTRMYVKGRSEGVEKNCETYPYFEEVHAILENSEYTSDIRLDEHDKSVYGIEEGSKVWPLSACEILLDEYEKKFYQFEDNGVKKRVLWQEIADTLAEHEVQVTAAQVENKWKVLLRCYKIAIGALEAPANSRKSQHFPFVNKMNQIFSLKEDSDEALGIGKNENRENQASWEHNGTMLLLQEYGARLERFDNEHLKRKEFLWHEIYIVFKENGFNYTVAQLMNRWKSLVKKYRTLVETMYTPDFQPLQLDEKTLNRIQKFPYLVEIGQLLGHNHDLGQFGLQLVNEQVATVKDDTLLSTAEIPQVLVTVNKNSKKKQRLVNKEPQTFKDVIKYFDQYEYEREALEQSRIEELKLLQDEKLVPLPDVEEMTNVIREFEEKRLQIEQQRLEEMAKMHREKMTVLKHLLKAVKKKNMKNSNRIANTSTNSVLITDTHESLSQQEQ